MVGRYGSRVDAASPVASGAWGTGWPSVPAPTYGARLRLVPGFLLFSVPPSASFATHLTDRRGPIRPVAVGWPRVDSVGRTEGSVDPSSGPAKTDTSPPGA